MGQHKIPGASKGSKYKADQHTDNTVLFYDITKAKPGMKFKMQDSRPYRIAGDGSFRRMDK